MAKQREFRTLESIGIEVVHLSPQERDAFREKLLPLYPRQAKAPALARMLDYVDQLRAGE